MAMFHRRRLRRFPRRRRPMVRRPRRYGMRRALRKTNVHSFVRWTEAPEGGRSLSCNFSSLGFSTRAYGFTLGDVVNSSEFTTLYDSYKITGVKIYFDYSPDVNTSVSVNHPAQYPKLWIKRDYDDIVTPTGLTEFQESNQSRCLRFNSYKTTQSIFIRPATRNTISGGTANLWQPWLNCGDPSVVHYGLKVAAEGIPSTNLGSITIRCKYYLKFKNVR